MRAKWLRTWLVSLASRAELKHEIFLTYYPIFQRKRPKSIFGTIYLTYSLGSQDKGKKKINFGYLSFMRRNKPQ